MTYNEILTLINSNLASGTEIQASKHREVEVALLDFANQNSSQQFDIKAIYANSTYLGDNFEANGLGKNLRSGWAICNGNNGTPNIGGRSIVAYGGDFTTLNAVGGSKDAVLVNHSHTYTQYTLDQEVATTGNGVITLNKNKTQTGSFITSTEGESGLNKNMHPYIVLVYIMKL
jgi:hypothetical protein